MVLFEDLMVGTLEKKRMAAHLVGQLCKYQNELYQADQSKQLPLLILSELVLGVCFHVIVFSYSLLGYNIMQKIQ